MFSVSGVGEDCGTHGPSRERCPPGSGVGKTGVSSGEQEGAGEAPAVGMAASLKARHLCDSRTGLWHTLPTESLAQLGWMLQPARGAHEVGFSPANLLCLLCNSGFSHPVASGAALALPAWKVSPSRSHPEKMPRRAPQPAQLRLIQRQK